DTRESPVRRMVAPGSFFVVIQVTGTFTGSAKRYRESGRGGLTPWAGSITWNKPRGSRNHRVLPIFLPEPSSSV
ncbi:MAG: hypothetical protein ACPHQT_06410, partial [Planctomycetota bacterium]